MSKAKLIRTAGAMPVVGPWLRRRAGRYEEGSVVSIKSGLAQGLKWKRHHRYVNGYWTGQYELEMQGALRRELREGGVFWDVGSNAGFFSLIARRLVGERGGVVSFDPDPDNCASIREQIEANRFGSEWRVEQCAVGGQAGTLPFKRATPGSPMGHLAAAGVESGPARSAEDTFDVPVVTFDMALDRFGAPDLVKMDIEGAEIMAMGGAARLLSQARPTWLVELHGAECERAVHGALGAHGYVFETIEGVGIAADAPALPKHFLARPGA